MAKVHLIGNAHLDPAWLWRWQEGYSEALATFRSALDRMNEFPDFIFTCASAAYYEWIEETDPDMFKEIQARVSEGRWAIAGGWYIQPDCNAPCGESFVRHALISRRYFASRFGTAPAVGYNVDSFGHSAMLPQILKRSGFKAYVFMRPNDSNEKSYPFDKNTFLWQSPDGSSIPAYRIADSYASSPFAQVAEKAKAMMSRAVKTGQDQMCFYGVGNHGGGPTIENVKALVRLIEREDGYEFSSPDVFFKGVNAGNLPILKGELQHHASGCYTAVMEIKKLNRMAESRLLAAEKYMVLARQLGHAGAYEPLERAWKQVLFNQFHDILGGCCIKSAYQDARENLGEALSAASRAINRALQWIAWNINTSRGRPVVNNKHDFRVWEKDNRGFPMTVFNHTGHAMLAPLKVGELVAGAVDELGNNTAVQTVRSEVTNGTNDKWESVILCDLPPLGWRTYWLYRTIEKPCKRESMLRANESELENDFAIVSIDPGTGSVSRLYDKANKREMLDKRTRALVVDEGLCDTWSHHIFSFRDEVGEFTNARLDLIEMGDVCASIRAVSTYGRSIMTVIYTMYRDKPGLHMSVTVNWQERHNMLKFCFPTLMRGGTDTASIPYGHITRTANGNEQPMRNWVMLREGENALGIATDWCSAYDAINGELRITALRSPVYADHFGARDDRCEFTQQGEWHFELAVLCGPDLIGLQREAHRLSCPPERVMGAYHNGTLPEGGSGILIEADNIRLAALKPSEDNSGAYIIRLNEIQGRLCSAHISLPLVGAGWMANFGPHEIKTFRIEGPYVQEVDLMEA